MSVVNWGNHQFTKQQMIERAIKHDPENAKRLDLERIALGGTVQLVPHDLYMDFGDWECMKTNRPIDSANCFVCGRYVLQYTPKMCCNGRDCGCMGLPIEPALCSDACERKVYGKET